MAEIKGGAKSLNDGWGEWGRHVLAELERNDNDHAELFRLVRKNEVDLVTLKVKAALVGALAGAILSVATALVIWAITK